VKRSAAVVIAVTLQRLVEDSTRFWSVEERLVLDALRRSSTALRDADVQELADHIGGLEPDQLRGVVSNVKGIYHELLFAHAENVDGDQVEALLFETTNRPGADVEFVVDGEVIDVLQLKAVESPAAIFEHLEAYPDIEVLATAEVATELPGIASSGFTNADLTRDVEAGFDRLPGEGLVEDVGEGAGTAGLMAAVFTAGQILREGRVSKMQLSAALGDVATGAVAATALDKLLDVVG